MQKIILPIFSCISEFQIKKGGKDAPRKLILKTLFSYLLHLPRLIEVETTTRCHLKCVMCEHTYWNKD